MEGDLAQDDTQEILPEELVEVEGKDGPVKVTNLADTPLHVGMHKRLPGEGEFPDLEVPEGSPD